MISELDREAQLKGFFRLSNEWRKHNQKDKGKQKAGAIEALDQPEQLSSPGSRRSARLHTKLHASQDDEDSEEPSLAKKRRRHL